MAGRRALHHRRVELDPDPDRATNWAPLICTIDQEAGNVVGAIASKSASSHFLLFRRFSQAGSTHNLSNCYDTSDNWTDNDMEIYMTRNATARTGLVPLWGRLFVSWYIDVLLDLDKVFWHLDEYDRQHRDTPIAAHDNFIFFVSLSERSDSSGYVSDELHNLVLSSLNTNANS